MRTFLLDTNVIIRFFVGDEKTLQRQAEEWFRQGQKDERRIIIPTLVIAETCFVLESFYGLKREQIARHLKVFVSQHWLIVEERTLLQKLFDFYQIGMHFVDAYLHTKASEQQWEILTFDKKLAKK